MSTKQTIGTDQMHCSYSVYDLQNTIFLTTISQVLTDQSGIIQMSFSAVRK
jgi:hypothetical protein